MSWNYEEKLIEYIAQANHDAGLVDENGNPYIFEVCSEQLFATKVIEPNKIYVVIKYLSSSNSLNVVMQPIQIFVLSEQNQLQVAHTVFSQLVASHNFEVIIEDGIYVKQDYREPVILSNFNAVSYGYRSVMYISATLYIMKDLLDVSNLSINGVEVKPLSFSISYSMTPNTQQIPPDKLSTSVKSIASFSISFVVPLINSQFVEKINEIMAGEESGNYDFEFKFKIGNVKFGYFEEDDSHLYMKLLSAQVTTAINEAPSLQIGMIR